MRLSVTLTYPASPSRVGAMLLDPEFLHGVCEATGDPEASVSVADSGDPRLVTTVRKLSTSRAPEAMRTIIGGHVTVAQRSEWPVNCTDAGWTGRVIVTVEGAPVRLDATATVAADGVGTRVSYDGNLAAKLPFIGGRVERGIEPLVRSAIEAEQHVGEAWLARHPA